MLAKDKLLGTAEQLKGRIEQAVGKTAGWDEALVRGHIDVTKGQARETVAHLRHAVDSQASEIQKSLAEAEGKAKAAISASNRSVFALAMAAAVILIALIGALIRGRLAIAELAGLHRRRLGAIDIGKQNASQAKATAQLLGDRVAGELEGLADQLTGKRASRGLPSLARSVAPLALLAAVATVVAGALAFGRRTS